MQTRLPFAAGMLALLSGTVSGNDGEQVFNETCSACHSTRYVAGSSGYDADGWRALIRTMVDLTGDLEREDALVDYLAKTFPPNDRRASVLVPGDLQLTWSRWKTPTLGQRSRDPVEDRSGDIWWVGQSGNILGRIERATGEMQEYVLPDGAMPHSVSIGPNGNPWYMGNKNGTVGYLDLKTLEIIEYKMPDPKARDPHTGVFDDKGILWFTLQQSNMVGKLDTKTGDIKLVTMPRPRSRPYGIKLDADGDLYIACNGSDCLVKMDRDTMELTLIDLPTPGTTVRRLAISEDGMVWYVNSGMGKLGRYNPETSEITEWPTPSGEDSHPYAIEVTPGAVWFNESRKRPETLVRFDTETETMQSWIIESGGVQAGLLRHMRASSKGILLHQTGTNHILEVSWK